MSKYHKTTDSYYQRSKKSKHSHRDDNEPTQEPLNLINYSFLDYKSQYTHILEVFSGTHAIIDDFNDFWMFVNKYESLLKRTGQTILTPDPFESNNHESTFLPSQYHKKFSINFSLKISCSDIRSRCYEYRQSIDENKLKHFFQIFLHYLDFKQKEKFKKLKNLRKFQKNLPVAKYRDDILKAVEENQIVIIAGDTGCGKSTQVPQYLRQGGFKAIGNGNYISN